MARSRRAASAAAPAGAPASAAAGIHAYRGRSTAAGREPVVDAYVEGLAVARLTRPDVKDLLRPPPRPGTDAAGAARGGPEDARGRGRPRCDARGGDIDAGDRAEGMRVIRDRLAVIAASWPRAIARIRWPSSATGLPPRCGRR